MGEVASNSGNEEQNNLGEALGSPRPALVGSSITRHWFGVLTTDNIDQVAALVREILAGRFAIAEASYCDSNYADLRLISADCELDSQWTSNPEREPVRVFKDDGHPWFSFSAGGFVWGFHARADGQKDHDDYHYPYFSFEYNKFTVTHRAPAGKGYLHKRAFGAHQKSENAQAASALSGELTVSKDSKAS